MRKISKISIHTSDSAWGDVNAIRSWHLQKGWDDVGYHFIVKNGLILPDLFIPSLNGHIDMGRPLNVTPAAVYGQNKEMIAICLIGKYGKYTAEQLMNAIKLCSDLIDEFNIPLNRIKGHYEYPNVHKTCPDMDMNNFRLAIKSYRDGVLK